MNIHTTHRRRGLAAVALACAGTLLLSSCGSSGTESGTESSTESSHASMPGMNMHSSMSSPAPHDMNDMNDTSGMSGMPMAQGTGLRASQDGYTLRLESGPTSGARTPLRFVITQGGRPVTTYRTEQTKQLHLYLVRSDLTGFQHLHPTMAADGTWTVTPAPIAAGRYRVYAQFEPGGADEPLVLSVPAQVGGTASTHPLPPASRSTTVDGYRLTLSGPLTRGGTVTVSFSKGGAPVTDLEPYLDTYAHVTGFRSDDLAFTHLHPGDAVTGDGGGPDLTFTIEAPEPGTYRLFLQFMAEGSLHTAAITAPIT